MNPGDSGSMYFQAFLMLYGPVEGCAGRGVLAGARGGRAGAVAAPRPPGGRRYWWRVPLLLKYKVALFVASLSSRVRLISLSYLVAKIYQRYI
jgi:hypothetical protein